jgi:ABC-type multidrug transport system fused ATPase/permease subunit
MYCTSLANSTSSISNSYTNIINGTFAVQKVFEMLDYKPLVDESIGQNLQITGDIEFRNVTFKYPTSKTVALYKLSLEIKQGEYIAFVGESGSGKSTIIKLIEKFYKIESGSIFYGRHNQEDINAICLRKQIGLVNQDATMFSGTIKGNITYGLDDYSVEDVEDASERSGCMEFLKDEKRFPKKFDSEVGEKGGNLSGGQKQRVSIARALMRNPKIIIFDEATSALDSNSERMVQDSIERLASNNRLDKPTIIVIAHRLSTVINADRIFVMKNGEVV